MSKYEYHYQIADEHLVAKVERGLRPDPDPGWEEISISGEIKGGDREAAAHDPGLDDESARCPA
jgi:hypothetical protein